MIFNIKTAFYSILMSALLCGVGASAQQMTPAAEYEAHVAQHPNESGVMIDNWKTFHISLVADTVQIIIEQYQEMLILDNPVAWVKDRAYSSSLSEVIEIEAYTLVPSKKKYKKVKVEDFKRSYDKNTYVFFDDTEWINYSYPQLARGCKIVTRQRSQLKDAHLLGQFFFGSYIPVANASVKMIVDDAIQVKYGIFNKELADIQFEVNKLDNGKTEYIYKAKDIPSIDSEDNMPSFNYLSPSVYMTIANYTVNGTTIPVMGSLEDLHSWYMGFIAELDIDESVKGLAESIVDESDSDLEKTRKIFYWVQSHIKYIAFEQGMRGFIPHQSGYILQKRYGDCKDMSCLLVGLLRSQDIPANFTWIGTRSLPYKYSEMPSPIIDNHMIASVKIDGKTIFLDATGNYSPIGFPTQMIQGKEALVSDNGEPKIEVVPIIPKEKNMMIDTSFVSLDGGTLTAEAILELTGLVKVANTYKLINTTSQGEENYLKRLLSKGSNKFFLDEFDTQNVDDLDQPIRIDYQYRVKDYYKSIGDKLYINLCLDKSLTNSQILDREVPIENDYKYINRAVTVLDLPAGYSVSFMPVDTMVETDHFGFGITYEQIGNRIYATKEFYVNYLLMYPTDFPEWNEAIKTYAKAVRTTVVLSKNND